MGKVIKLEEPLPLTDGEWDASFREGATDEETESVLRHVFYWAWIVRDHGKCVRDRQGYHAGRAIRYAFELADAHAMDQSATLDNPVDEIRAINGPWRFVLWPPILDADPGFGCPAFEPEGTPESSKKRNRQDTDPLRGLCPSVRLSATYVPERNRGMSPYRCGR